MKRIVVLTGAVVAAIALGACSSDSSDGSMGGMDMGNDPTSTTATSTSAEIPADADFNAADVAFAQGMIPHHTQAIEMADMASGRASSPEVFALAAQIKAAQGPEIEQLTSWLEDWGQDVPSGSMSMDSGSDSMPMDGMMSDSDMTMLSDASGAAFDQMFLSMMVIHHKGAVTMAEQEGSEGKYEPAIEMAQTIVETQNAEIEKMNQLLSALPAS